MTRGELEGIVRSVLQRYGVDLTLQQAELQDQRWHLLLAGPHVGVPIRPFVPDGSAYAVREALLSALEIEG